MATQNEEMREPKITVNGIKLTEVQSMTIRVALNSFDFSLSREGLGEDDIGRSMVKNYRKIIDRINNYLQLREGG